MRLKEMVSFFDAARKRGIVSPNTVHNWLGAVSAISQSLKDEERTVEFLQARPTVVRERLQCREVSSRTIDAYMARSTTAISHFLAWTSDPIKWEQDIAARPRKERVRKAREAKAGVRLEKSNQPAPFPTANSVEASHSKNRMNIPTENAEGIRLEFPSTLTMADVIRATWALAVHARDFDPELLVKGFGKPTSPLTLNTLLSVGGNSH